MIDETREPGPAEAVESEAGEGESELDAARRQAEEYLSDLRRLAADFDNYRKRVARDTELQSTRATESLVPLATVTVFLCLDLEPSATTSPCPAPGLTGRWT